MDQEKMISIFRKYCKYDTTMGFELKIIAPGEIIYYVKIDERHLSSPDACHGGVLSGMMDSTLGYTALTHAIGLIYFTPLDQPVYVASVGMIIIGLSAISVIAFGASIYAVLSFFIPVTLPIILYFLYSPGVLQTYVTAGVLLYAAVVLSALKQINKAFKNSISLNFQHQQEIEKRKFAERKLQELSRRDSLTKLFNRRHFDEFLNIEINKSL